MEKNDWCILCMKHTKLTQEHVPPRKLGNTGNKKTRTGSLEDFFNGDFSTKDFPRGIKRKAKGNTYYTLCADCNSFFGSEYVKEYIKFAEDNRQFLYRNTSLKNGKPHLTHSLKKINPLRIGKEIVAMFFSINGEKETMDTSFLDSVRSYLANPKNNSFPHKDYKIVMNYYLPVSVAEIPGIRITNDIVGDKHTHNIIKPFINLKTTSGEKIRFSEIQYEGIGLTLIDLKETTFAITEGVDLETLLGAEDKTKKIHLYKIPILTPTVLTMTERRNGIKYDDPGSDLLVRWQLITDSLTETKRSNNAKLDYFQNV